MNPKHKPGLSDNTASDSKEDDTRSIKQREQQIKYVEGLGMSDRQKEMYRIFCESRAQVRAAELEEDIKVRNLFIELGRQAATDALDNKKEN